MTNGKFLKGEKARKVNRGTGKFLGWHTFSEAAIYSIVIGGNFTIMAVVGNGPEKGVYVRKESKAGTGA